MKVLMLGWEYPPHISGGLGTACEGLTKALSRQNVAITFVVPSLLGGETAPHMDLIDSGESVVDESEVVSVLSPQAGTQKKETTPIRSFSIPAFLSPYWTPQQYEKMIAGGASRVAQVLSQPRGSLNPQEGETIASILENAAPAPTSQHYGWDMFEEVSRYTARVVEQMGNETFDVIHAHDWMTYPAGVALARLTGKPLVAHVHSLESDRSGDHVNHQIDAIERWGLREAQAVIAVSHYTRGTIVQRHEIPKEKVHVVHNGVYPKEVAQKYRENRGWSSKVVLFLGRITFQKGPDYFVEAAAKVIPHVPDVMFVMAGAGDMLPRMVERVKELGILDNFYFPGFLRGLEVEQMFSVADVYVMPSVSEPFGISALEAISFDTPVVISRQSGVAEVLAHALKVDFWDIERLADLIINALIHEELRNDMVAMAREEVKRVRWDASALKTIALYHQLGVA